MVEEEDPDLLVLQLLAADQLGHVRGVRSPEYLDQLAETDRHVGDFLAFLEERGRLDGATVILMADHGQGRGIGGHGHLDWGERPVPFVVWGEGARARRRLAASRARCWSWRRRSRLLGVPAPAAARGRPLLPAYDGGEGGVPGQDPPGRCEPDPGRLPRKRGGARSRDGRCARRGARRWPSCSPVSRARRAGLPVDVLLVDDGSTRRHAGHRPRARCARALARGLARARRRAARRARDRARRGLRRGGLHRRRRRVRPRRASSACSSRSRAGGPTTCSARASSASARA